MKTLIGIIAIILTFVGYVPYIRDTIAKKTKPHVYTWFSFGITALIIFAAQISGGGGFGAYVYLAASLISFSIFIISFKNGNRDITKVDTISFIAALIALGAWLIVKIPIYSVILIVFVDMFSFIPTIRKSWDKPFQETLFSYELNTVRFVLALYALSTYSIVTALSPVVWLFANGLFSIFLIIRRRHFNQIK